MHCVRRVPELGNRCTDVVRLEGTTTQTLLQLQESEFVSKKKEKKKTSSPSNRGLSGRIGGLNLEGQK